MGPTPLLLELNMVQPLRKWFSSSQNVKHKVTVRPNKCAFRNRLERNENTRPHENLYTYVHKKKLLQERSKRPPTLGWPVKCGTTGMALALHLSVKAEPQRP